MNHWVFFLFIATQIGAQCIAASPFALKYPPPSSELTQLSRSADEQEKNQKIATLLQSCDLPIVLAANPENTKQSMPSYTLIPYKVVIRREATESYLKRHPHVTARHLFPHLVTEFFLEAQSQWNNTQLMHPNPLIIIKNRKGELYNPKNALCDQQPFAVLSDYPLKNKEFYFYEMRHIAQHAFLVLEKAWELSGHTLTELTLQFGLDADDNLVIVLNSTDPSWQITPYAGNIPRAFSPSCPFGSTGSPQQIILWMSAQQQEIMDSFSEQLKPYLAHDISLTTITCAVHLDPITAYQSLLKQVQEIPDTIILVYEEKGTHASALLSAQTIAPVISVQCEEKNAPAHEHDFTAPREAPVLGATTLENARIALLQLLAQRNPRLYAQLHMERIDRMRNIISLH